MRFPSENTEDNRFPNYWAPDKTGKPRNNSSDALSRKTSVKTSRTLISNIAHKMERFLCALFSMQTVQRSYISSDSQGHSGKTLACPWAPQSTKLYGFHFPGYCFSNVPDRDLDAVAVLAARNQSRMGKRSLIGISG